MTKNNLESENFLKNVECNLTFLKSNKEYIFSDETSERDKYFTIVINEFSIKVHVIQKTLNIFNVDQDESIDNNVYFRKIHFDLFNDDYQFQIQNLSDVKLAFDYIYLKICFLQLLQNKLDINLMLKFIIEINQDVIQISYTELI